MYRNSVARVANQDVRFVVLIAEFRLAPFVLPAQLRVGAVSVVVVVKRTVIHHRRNVRMSVLKKKKNSRKKRKKGSNVDRTRDLRFTRPTL